MRYQKRQDFFFLVEREKDEDRFEPSYFYKISQSTGEENLRQRERGERNKNREESEKRLAKKKKKWKDGGSCGR